MKSALRVIFFFILTLSLSGCFFSPTEKNVRYGQRKILTNPDDSDQVSDHFGTSENEKRRKTKKALVISGGGVKGSFAVGILKALFDFDSNFYKQYDVFAATSTGSLIIPLASVGMFDSLEFLYTASYNISNYYRSNGDIVDVLRRGSAMYNTDGLRQKVRDVLRPLYTRLWSSKHPALIFASVSMTKGDLVYFSNKMLEPKSVNRDKFTYQKVKDSMAMVNAIMASANQPVFADLVNMYNAKYDRIEQFGDGGIRDYLPIQAAIDLGDTAIDVIQCSPFFFDEKQPYNDILSILSRTLNLVTDAAGQANIDYSKLNLASGGIIRIFRPPHSGYGAGGSEDFPFLSSNLTFDEEKMKVMFDKGYEIGNEYMKHIPLPAEVYEEYRQK